MNENKDYPRFFVTRVMLLPSHICDFDERKFVKTIAAYYICDNFGNVEYASNDIDYTDSATDEIKDAVESMFDASVFEVDDSIESLVLRRGLHWCDVELSDNVEKTMENAVEHIQCNSPYSCFMNDPIDEKFYFNK